MRHGLDRPGSTDPESSLVQSSAKGSIRQLYVDLMGDSAGEVTTASAGTLTSG